MEIVNKIINSLGLEVSEYEKNQTPKKLLRTVMSKWLNVVDTLLEMITIHLPSPRIA